jgi:two-component system, NtrC family, sensor kinase
MLYHLSSWLNRSLTLKTMAWLGFPVIGVSSLAIAGVYLYTFHRAEVQVREDLQHYLEDRVQYGEIFQLAEVNQKNLKQNLLERLVQPFSSDTVTRFNKQMYQWSDQTSRNFPQNKDFKTFPALQKATVFIGPQVKVSDELKGQILLFEELASLYGRAFSSQYNNTWINGSQNISVDYRPGTLWGLEAVPSTDITQEEYGLLATVSKNPDRSSRWTSLYFDPIPARWMVSLVTPVDYKGKHIATIGNDIILNELIDVSVRNNFPHSRNILFQKDGQLVVHPDRMEEIKASGGKLNLQAIDDPELNRIFQDIQAKPQDKSVTITQDRQTQSFLAVTQIKGPGWYWVTIYPNSELMRKAIKQTMPLIVFGVLALLMELLLLYQVLRRNVHRPLAKLSAATDSISHGDFEVKLDTNRADELGSLARSFSSMVSQLQTSFSQLASYNATLETQVQDKTEALSNTLTDLELAQAQLVQSEKMSSLGQMVAGIAHEVNNPIGFVYGNLQHAETYIKQLLEHIALYHQIEPIPESIQRHGEAIDLAFLQSDLPKLLASMKIGADRIQEIVSSLRTFSRIDGVQLSHSDLHEGLESTLLILAHRLKRAPQLPIVVEKYYASLPKIQCYPGLLNQVFMNLIGNAIDALESVEQAIITITSRQINQQVEIIIADNGKGIPETLLPQIFNPFFTTKEIGKGTGLGLSISHQIITERHHGSLICRSSNQGTQFIITIPIEQVE